MNTPLDALTQWVLIAAMAALLATLYFVPTIMALFRERCTRRRAKTVFLVNLFLGWSGIGWWIAFGLAYTAGESAGNERKIASSR